MTSTLQNLIQIPNYTTPLWTAICSAIYNLRLHDMTEGNQKTLTNTKKYELTRSLDPIEATAVNQKTLTNTKKYELTRSLDPIEATAVKAFQADILAFASFSTTDFTARPVKQ